MILVVQRLIYVLSSYAGHERHHDQRDMANTAVGVHMRPRPRSPRFGAPGVKLAPPRDLVGAVGGHEGLQPHGHGDRGGGSKVGFGASVGPSAGARGRGAYTPVPVAQASQPAALFNNSPAPLTSPR